MTDSAIITFSAAFGLSLTYNLVPGPVTVETLRRGAARGVRAALAVRLGSLGGSLFWAIAAFSGAGVAAQHPAARLLLTVAGIGTLLYLAARALLPERQTPAVPAATAKPATRHGDTLTGVLIGIASPMEAAFWLGVSGTLLSGATTAERITDTSAFLAGFIAADLLFTVCFAFVVSWGRNLAGGRVAQVANALSVATLTWFALTPVVQGLGTLAG